MTAASRVNSTCHRTRARPSSEYMTAASRVNSTCHRTRARPSSEYMTAASRVNSTCGVKPGSDALGWSSSQIQFLEEVVALVVDDDEGGKILHLDLPHRLHPEFGILHGLDLLDAVFGQVRRRAADRGEVKA